MALLNLDNKYIKLNSDGTFEIYASKEARLRTKQCTESGVILEKYRFIAQELEADLEFRYFDPTGFAHKYDPWIAEYLRYEYNLSMHIVGETYPLMSEFYPDVADSIPQIIESGSIDLSGDALTELYTKAKERKYWGDTLDV